MRIDPQETKVFLEGQKMLQPAAPEYRAVGDSLLEMPTAPGQQPRVAFTAPQKPQQIALETFSPFTQADGSVVMVGNRGGQRTTNLRGQVKTDPAQTKKDDKVASNQQALHVYKTGMAGLTAAMRGAETGPLVGRLPAFTAAQQTADGAVAAMAPVLKQLFRSAGEGVFTDKDQEMLIAMLPTRADRPRARNAKIANINRIVEAKLGAAPQSAPAAAPKVYTTKGGATVEILE
jgi:hypothetical protein